MNLMTSDNNGHKADCTWDQLRRDLEGEGYNLTFIACAEQDLIDGKSVTIGGGAAPLVTITKAPD